MTSESNNIQFFVTRAPEFQWLTQRMS